MKVAKHGLVLAALLVALPASALAQDSGSWTDKTVDIAYCSGNGFCSDGTYYYAVSGSQTDVAYSTLMRRYDPATDSWTALMGLPIQISSNCAAYHGGNVYSFGSILYPPMPGGPARPTAPIYRYSVAANTWTLVATATADRNLYYSTATRIGDKIYLAGGKANLPVSTLYSNNLSEFDPVTETMTAKADLPGLGRMTPASGTDGSKFYLMGGRNYDSVNAVSTILSETLVYDPATDAWSQGAPIHDGVGLAPRWFGRAASLDGRIYLSGGRGSTATEIFNTMLEYVPAMDRWIPRAPMASIRGAHGTAAIGGRIFVFSGTDGVSGSTIAYQMSEFTPPSYSPQVTQIGQYSGATSKVQGAVFTGPITFRATVALASDPLEEFNLQVEVKPATDPDWTTATALESGLAPQGDLQVVHTPAVYGSYDWRYRIVGAAGTTTPWSTFAEFGVAGVSPDFVFQAPPAPPASGGGGGGGGGGCGASGSSAMGPAALLGAVLVLAAWALRVR